MVYLRKYLSFFALSFVLASGTIQNSFTQEIDFGSYSSAYSVTLSEVNIGENLDFGLLVQNEGLISVPIAESKVLSILGVKYLDVIVDVTADDYLLLNGNLSCLTDPSCRIPYTLQASYANNGSNTFSEAVNFTVVSNVASAQFPIKRRTGGPPSPPPTPVYEGYNPNLFQETAYLYIYGSLNVGNVTAGSYTIDIMVTISYD
tara:strand:+ start:4056 stop:4664 length:609 start_codon:yes stop_codon:yes gene_type:complete